MKKNCIKTVKLKHGEGRHEKKKTQLCETNVG